ncbi:MAG: beta-lactamase family protein [Proteobacteria bacterium]|nr:beta-lactamase family protein [Pseudomonadota bacterium]
MPTPIRTGLFWALVIAAVPAAWLIYRLFEPMLSWSSGWQDLPPRAESDQHFSGTSDPAWAALAGQADEALRAARAELQAPALSAAVLIDDRRVWAAATGYADLATARPVALDSRFRIGSSSKAVNALAMGVLMEAGRVDIDAPVRRYLPELPPAYDGVTTRLAISHRAGIPDYGLCLCLPVWEHKNRRHFDGVRPALAVFADRPLRFAPGTDFAYSSYGANVAGAVLEAAAGRPYGEMVAQTVFEPLAMQGSRLDVAGAADPQRVGFYETHDGRYKQADPVDNSIRYPSGGMLSTPSDMLALGRAWIEPGRLVNATTLGTLLAPQKLADGSANPQGYALGMRVFADKKLFEGRITTRFFSHHGTAVGSTSYFAIYPEYRMVISVMMNKGQDNVDALAAAANRLAELFIAEQVRRRGQAVAGVAAEP